MTTPTRRQPATQRLAAAATAALDRRFTRRSMLARMAVVGSAVTTSGFDYLLHPGTAYASVCGESSSCAGGWTAMCCTINHGVNQCPPGSFAGGWWKAEGANLCGGKARYYVDCQGECTHCGCHGSHFCSESCWDCTPHCAHHGGCDQRRVCHNVFRYGQCEQDRQCSGPVLCRAISCTPPWKWADCTRTAATDNLTVSHSAPCLATWTAIQQRYTHLGSEGSVLGPTVRGELTHPHGHIQDYAHGRMYWTEGTGAHFLTHRILHRYVELGELASPLGPPTTDSTANPHGEGWRARFAGGGIYRLAPHDAHGLWGPIWEKWIELQLGNGPLGFPTTDVSTTTDGKGRFAHFVHGAIYQGPGLGAHDLYDEIATKYRELGYQTSPVGYPTADQRDVADGEGVAGHELECETGVVAGALGHPAAAVWGPIYTTWDKLDRAGGELGFPVSDVTAISLADGPGQTCVFAYGTATYDATTGKVSVVLS